MRRTLTPLSALAVLLMLGCADRPEPPPAQPTPGQPTTARAEAPEATATAQAPAVAPGEAESPAADAPPEPPPAPPGFMPVPPAFDSLPLTARLPADALGLFVVAAPADLARRIGLADVLDALGPDVVQARAEMKAALGHDLLDPQAWPAAGVDPARAAGVAVLRAEPALLAISVAVKDADALVETISASSLFEPKAVEADGVRLYRIDPLAFAVKGDEGWLVIGDRLVPGEALHHARALATRPDATLLEREAVGPVVARLNYGRDVAAIVNLPALFDAALRDRLGTAPHTRVERELRGAEALGETERAETLRADLKQRRQKDPGWGGGTVAAGMVARSYLSAFGGLALGVNIEPDAVQVRVAHRLDRDSPVGRLFASRSGPLTLRAAFERPPAGLAEINLDPAGLGELMRAAALVLGGGGMGRAETELREVTGRDLNGMLKLLAGDMGAAVEIDPARVTGSASADALLDGLRFAGHVGLADPAGTTEVLDRLTKLPDGMLAPLDGPADGPRRWRLGLGPRRTVWLAIADHQLFAALDEGTTTRLTQQSAQDPGPGFVASLPSTPRAMLDGRDGGWSGWLDIGGLGPLMIESEPMVLREAPPGAPATAALRAEIVALDRQIAEHRRAHRAAQVKRGRALLATLGRAAASVRPTPTGLDARAGLYPGAGGVRGAALAFAREVRAQEAQFRTLYQETLQPLYEKQRALRAQIEALEAGGADRP